LPHCVAELLQSEKYNSARMVIRKEAVMSLEATMVPTAHKGKINVFTLNLSLLATKLLPCGSRVSQEESPRKGENR